MSSNNVIADVIQKLKEDLPKFSFSSEENDLEYDGSGVTVQGRKNLFTGFDVDINENTLNMAVSYQSRLTNLIISVFTGLIFLIFILYGDTVMEFLGFETWHNLVPFAIIAVPFLAVYILLYRFVLKPKWRDSKLLKEVKSVLTEMGYDVLIK